MAVQAQYPSNILLLNRNGQEQQEINLGMGGDYLLPGEFIPQSVLIDSGGFINRKRGREAAISDLPSANLFSPQNQIQPPMSANLSLPFLQQQQQALVSTGLRLSHEDQTQHHQKLQLQKLGLLLPSPALAPSLAEASSVQIKQLGDEIDQFLQSQSEHLKRTLAEKSAQHYRSLLGAAQQYAARRLSEKGAELEKATRRNSELEWTAAGLVAEARTWQARGRAQEADAASLQAQLRQALLAGPPADARDSAADDAESAHVDPSREAPAVPPCLACRSRPVAVLLLPCRHLCLCAACEPAVHICPVCCTLRNATMEVYLS